MKTQVEIELENLRNEISKMINSNIYINSLYLNDEEKIINDTETYMLKFFKYRVDKILGDNNYAIDAKQ